ncbi:serine/threonine-protein kinase DCLK3 isoform X2 [Pezoporus wallicus]|uniref:serine/threonine-protein kinase DCLK3 isoform X2 n=1 Tax=Pezoporus wallicus TaxID=35540 RepID=UPI00254D4FDA|nr:serine/threonine-protein kinase DCLK3 isoform X2 [Pezoporus wallicus]XP_061320307.1 serine/threonine-protein kinase DCLK3 isoform X2 [Pezoporus flaviventris]
MPAAAPPPLHPAAGSCCPYGHCAGRQALFDHSPHNSSSKVKERKLQGTCPPLGRRSYGKACLHESSQRSPLFNPRNGFHTLHSEHSPVKPRIITVVKPGGHTLRRITLLLNRRSVQTFEQLMADISEALGFPRWKNDRVRKLYNLRGREIQSVSDFFREGDAFIAMGREPLTLKDLEVVLQELYPENPYAASAVIQQNEEQSQKLMSRLYDKASKVDGGFDETEIAKNCSNGMSPKLAAGHKGKSQAKAKQEEKMRTKKKWSREGWDGEQGAKPSRKIRESERYFSRERSPEDGLEESSEEVVRCEKCEQERQARQKLERERRAEASLESRDLTAGACQRYHIERNAKIRNCRKSSETCLEGEEVGWKDNSCRRTWKPLLRNVSEGLEKQKRSIEKERDVEKHESHGKEVVKIKKNAVEGLQLTREAKEENGSSCIMNQSGWLKKDTPRDAEKPSKTHREGQRAKEEGARREGNIACRESDLTRREKTGERRANKEESKAQGLEGTSRRHAIKNRTDVEKHYEIGRTIGDGNFAVVKECRHCDSNQIYAMKIVDKSKLKGKEDMMESEILIIRSLSHPNIVSLIEVYETEAEIYLILEYVPGGDLFDAIIESVKFTEHDAAVMITDLCEALVYIHSKNIVHRDLKPENLLVQHNADKSTTLKLADFGLAKQVTKPIFTVCGTPTYVAPEILAEKGYGLEVDMWAAGVILYILLCGFPPFRSQDRDQEELFQIIQLGHYEFLSPYWDNISAAKDLITRLLIVDPQKRYTARQVLQHPWIRTAGKTNSRNLQKEVTINIERHFRAQRRREAAAEDT